MRSPLFKFGIISNSCRCFLLPLFLHLSVSFATVSRFCWRVNLLTSPPSQSLSCCLLFSLGTLTQHSDEVAGGWSSSRCAAPGHGLVPICLSRLFNYFCRLLVAICQLLPRPRPLPRKMLLHLDVRLLPVSSSRNTLSAPSISLSFSLFLCLSLLLSDFISRHVATWGNSVSSCTCYPVSSPST